jgi:Fungalysin metallopeptidase (M36)/Fungalysin/Thermolysin Propeptide Motif
VRIGSGREAWALAGSRLGFGTRWGCVAVLAIAAAALPSTAAAAPAKVDAKLRSASAPTSELRQSRGIPLPGGATIYRFQQQVAGVKVLNGQAVVNDPAGAPPHLIADATARNVEPPPSPRIGKGRAVAIASQNVNLKGLRRPRSASLVVAPGDGGTLAWKVELPSARPPADYEVLVDAVSGEVLSVHNLLQDFRTGRAKLYDPNPVVENGGFKGLRSDHNDRDTKLLTSLRRRVSLRKIKGGQDCLRGEWANAKVGRHPKAVCRESLNWTRVTRSADAFEALMVYYHITRAQQYIHDLGFGKGEPGHPIDDRSQMAVADAFGADNSFYSPFTRDIKYGSGGVDDAEDGDVILHEYGHAMQDSESHSFSASSSFEATALAEGSADYWAAAMSSRSPGTTNEDDVCIFDWDATTYGRQVFPPVAPYTVGRRCGRRADDPRTVAQAKTGSCGQDPHCVGQVWSSGLWDLRQQIGGRKMDTIYLMAQFMYHANEDFNEAAAALLQADQDLTGGANATAICTEMQTNRGLTVPGC